MLADMGLLLDSFWRAAAYCLRPRVMALSVLPLLVMLGLALGLGYLYWDAAVQGMRGILDASTVLATFWNWLQGWGLGDVASVVAPLMVILAVAPVLVVLSLLLVAVLMTPALVSLVADRRFPNLERKKGGSFIASVAWSLGSTALALIALVVSVPLWLVPPLVLILPPLIWGWLTYRVMVFDALADHASKEERQEIFRRHRSSLLGIGILTGYLGAAPSIVWASGVVFAAAFVVLVPLAIWIYTLVFAFSSLWFAHYGLAALEQLRAENAALAHAPPAGTTLTPRGAPDVVPPGVDAPVALPTAPPAPAALPAPEPSAHGTPAP
ncbi:MAG: EI24 domain-containing protein [Acidovorax sp.]|nr:MAG: EI24 domain-containing protein [Acidovorax sp.]